MSATLADIRTKVRRVTGLANPAQLSDTTIDFYINTFYLYDLPESMKLLTFKETYQFYTEPYVATYAFPKELYTLVEPLIQVNGYETQWFQDKTIFNRTFTTLDVQEVIAVGDGTPGPFSAITSSQPVLAGYTNGLGTIISNVIVSATDTNGDPLVIRDDGAGGFLDSSGNTVVGASINYLTGAITAVFTANTLNATDITMTYNSYSATRPTSVLFFEDTFTFRPVPDQAYIVNMNVYKVPTAIAGTDRDWETIRL